eukprot:8051889-Alexandrium_andersonii.AAC.1
MPGRKRGVAASRAHGLGQGGPGELVLAELPADRSHACRRRHNAGQRDQPRTKPRRGGRKEPCNRLGGAGRSKEEGLSMPTFAAPHGDDRGDLSRPAFNRLVYVGQPPLPVSVNGELGDGRPAGSLHELPGLHHGPGVRDLEQAVAGRWEGLADRTTKLSDPGSPIGRRGTGGPAECDLRQGVKDATPRGIIGVNDQRKPAGLAPQDLVIGQQGSHPVDRYGLLHP